MKRSGSGMTPCSTRKLQNWRDTWNCSLMSIALLTSTVPSGRSGE